MAKVTNLYLITAIVTLGGLLQGFDVFSLSAIISTTPFKNQFHKPNASTQGGITASLSGGSFLGCFFAFLLIDRIGRKLLLQITSLIFIVGAIFCGPVVDVAMLIVRRLVCGFAVG
jgi:MFS family permease